MWLFWNILEEEGELEIVEPEINLHQELSPRGIKVPALGDNK